MFNRSKREFEEVKAVAGQDLAMLADDIVAMDAVVSRADVDPLVAADYGSAAAHYETASSALARSRSIADLRQVSAAIDEARYAMGCAKARAAGEPVPDRRPPCFFDPAHGPSLSDVDWTLPGGTRRRVAACGQCAVAVLQGGDPAYRQVQVSGGSVPHWQAPGHYRPYSDGYYDRRGGLGGALIGGLAGLAAGTLLGDALAAGDGWGDER